MKWSATASDCDIITDRQNQAFDTFDWLDGPW